jgi:hypothetical protein
VHLLLDDDAVAVLVVKLDRVLDGDDLAAALAVDEVHHVVERCRLADAGRAGDQDQAVGLAGQLVDDRRQAQRLARAHGGFRDADGHLWAAAVVVDAGAEASDVGPVPGEAELPLLFEDFFVLVGEQLVEERAEHRADFAVHAEGGGDAANEVDVAGPEVAARAEDLVECGHRVVVRTGAAGA